MMLNGGELNGTRLLSPKSVQLMTSNHLEGIKPGKYYLPGPGYGLVWGTVCGSILVTPRRLALPAHTTGEVPRAPAITRTLPKI